MTSRWPAATSAAWAAAVSATLTSAPVYAQPPTTAPEAQDAPAPRAAPTSEDIRAADRRFSQGEAAYRLGDFVRAADAFEAAYALAPQEDVLWNAARARQRTGELARAANLYARYLHDAKPGARDRSRAIAALSQLATKLARIDVQAPASDAVTVDDVALSGRSLYVNPGSHVVRARRPDHDEERIPSIGAGQVLSVAFDDDVPAPIPAPPASVVLTPAPAAAAVAPEAASHPPPREATPLPPPSHKLSPWVFAVEGAATFGCGVATIVSGVDTRRARDAYNTAPSQQALTDGQSKELRTNVLLGVTSGLALLTAVTGIWFVDWHGRGERTGGLHVSVGAAIGRAAGAAIATGTF